MIAVYSLIHIPYHVGEKQVRAQTEIIRKQGLRHS